jgi:hypothetical protein
MVVDSWEVFPFASLDGRLVEVDMARTLVAYELG